MKPTPELLFIITYVAALIWAAFSVYVIFVAKRTNKKLTERNESLSVESLNMINEYDAKIKSLEFDNKRLSNENTSLYNSLNDFKNINDSLVKSNDQSLKEFESFVRLYADRNGVELDETSESDEAPKPVKRSVTTLQEKECIRIGEGDWEKLAPLFEDAGIVWWKGQKASEIIPEIGYCVSVNYYGKNELTQDSEHFNVENGLTVLPASDFIEPEPIEAPKPVKHLSEANAIDWSKPVAFPDGYEIPENIKVIALTNGDYGKRVDINNKIGETKGNPFINGSYVLFDGQVKSWFMYQYELAPINPTDHPNHPDYENRN